ncbi:MAG TPA: hypothetical protein VMB51_11110 [Solirubrobacteraceae bacterium]|nr:hypothetical protein [Solirubrobacteraceae bacterium]
MRLRSTVVAALAGIACIAVFAASASAAAPEFGRCLKAEKVDKEYKGKFSNSGCTTEVPVSERPKKGKYEWFPGAVKNKQTSVGGSAALETAVKHLGVGCAGETSIGEYVGTKEVKNIFVTFTGCHSGPEVCQSPGHAKGELETNALEGTIVWENKAKKKTDFMLIPQGGKEKFIEFTCGLHLTVSVRGKILTPIKNDKMKTTETLKYKATRGIQKPDSYETESGGKENAFLESLFLSEEKNEWEQAGQSITSKVTNEEALELNLVV